MSWNIEGIAILLSQWAFGIVGFVVALLWAFWTGTTFYKCVKSKKRGETLFNAFKWRFARIAITLLIMIALASALGTYRPRVTAGSGANSGFGSMTTTPRKEVEVAPAWKRLGEQQDKAGHTQSDKVRENYIEHTPNQ